MIQWTIGKPISRIELLYLLEYREMHKDEINLRPVNADDDDCERCDGSHELPVGIETVRVDRLRDLALHFMTTEAILENVKRQTGCHR
jgi:hypothetical protein